jgi:hypothetical protein
MVVFFIGLIAIIILIVMFIGKAGKRKQEGKGLGDPHAGNSIHNPNNQARM